MAKVKQPREAVKMTAPRGAKVTVPKESVDKYKARGYKLAAGRTAKSDQASEK